LYFYFQKTCIEIVLNMSFFIHMLAPINGKRKWCGEDTIARKITISYKFTQNGVPCMWLMALYIIFLIELKRAI
jgi:hypothetical protein